MRLTIILIVIFLSAHEEVASQIISSSLPEKINPNERFIFYLHGGVVTGRGDNVVNQSMHGTCEKIFADRKYIESKNEVVLYTALS